MTLGLLRYLRDKFGSGEPPQPKRRPVRQKYKIEHHPKYGYVAFHDEAPGREYGRWWSPLNHNSVAGLHSDHYLNDLLRDDYFVKTEEEAGERVNTHATRGGAKVIWRG